MKKVVKISAVITLIIFAFFFSSLKISAQSDSGDATPTLEVTGECNNNGTCESELSENSDTCPSDCGCNNNGTCETERNEDASNCPADCQKGGIDVPEVGLYIQKLKLNKITFESAEILWETNKPAMCVVSVGQTQEYEKEIVSEIEYYTGHLVELTNLRPSTVYHFNIFCQNVYNLTVKTGDKYFATLSVIANVSNFIAVSGEEEIFLSWKNPDDKNFDSVRLIRNELFFPINIYDGIVLYQGSGESFTDEEIEISKGYYYAIFAKGKDGSWSSGALAYSIVEPPPVTTPITPPVTPPITPPITPPVTPPAVPPELKLSLEDFDFYSEGTKLPLIDGKTIEIGINKILIISVPYEKIPDAYKKIVVEINAGENRFYYLFSPNNEKTVYNTNFISPDKAGKYPLIINIFNEKNELVLKLEGELSVFSKPKPAAKNIILIILIWISKYRFYINIFLFVLLILLILLLLLMLLMRRKKDDDDKEQNNFQNQNLVIK